MKTPTERIDALLSAQTVEGARALLIHLLGRIEAAATLDVRALTPPNQRVAREEMRAALWAIAQAEQAAASLAKAKGREGGGG